MYVGVDFEDWLKDIQERTRKPDHIFEHDASSQEVVAMV